MNKLRQLQTVLCCVAVHLPALAHPGAHETLDYLSARIDAHPNSPELFYQRGVAYLDNGLYESALQDLQRAAAMGDPQYLDYQLGMVYFRTADYAAARQCFDRYLNYRPGHPGSLRYRARVHGLQDNYPAALLDYQALFTLSGQTTPADYIAASELLLDSPLHDIDHALSVLDRGMQTLGIISQLQRPAIELEVSEGSYDNAIARLQTLAPNPPGNPFWQLEMGQLLLAAGEEQRANQHFTEAEQQLDELRKTPARVQLAQELQKLKTR